MMAKGDEEGGRDGVGGGAGHKILVMKRSPSSPQDGMLLDGARAAFVSRDIWCQ